MCIRVQTAPLHEIVAPWDADRRVIAIPAELSTSLFILRAVRAVLHELGVPQDHFGARCWCGDEIDLTPRTTTHQRHTDEVIGLGS